MVVFLLPPSLLMHESICVYESSFFFISIFMELINLLLLFLYVFCFESSHFVTPCTQLGNRNQGLILELLYLDLDDQLQNFRGVIMIYVQLGDLGIEWFRLGKPKCKILESDLGDRSPRLWSITIENDPFSKNPRPVHCGHDWSLKA